MSDRLDEILQRAAAESAAQARPQNLDKITALIGESLIPVRPIAPLGLHVALLFVVCAAVALASAFVLGFDGVHELPAATMVAILSVLAVLGAGVAYASASIMRPGSRRLVSAGTVVWIVSAVTAILFATLFVHYGFAHFFAHGMVCLRAGLLQAAIAALLMWFVLRRTYAVDPKAAGTVIGTMAGFAGVVMLELCCTDFQAQHLLVWHTAVLPCSALLGRLVAGTISRWRSR